MCNSKWLSSIKRTFLNLIYEKNRTTFFSTFYICKLFSQNKLAYRLFDIKGKKVSYKALKKQVLKADIILFGEFHDNPISHWLELEIIKDLNKSENLIIGAEMFESDNQQLINDYLSGALNFNTLDSMGRLWSNYKRIIHL